jgi:hypothetical protein
MVLDYALVQLVICGTGVDGCIYGVQSTHTFSEQGPRLEPSKSPAAEFEYVSVVSL